MGITSAMPMSYVLKTSTLDRCVIGVLVSFKDVFPKREYLINFC